MSGDTARAVTAATLLLALAGIAHASPADSTASDSTAVAAPATAGDGLIYLVPELEGAGFTVSDDRERYRHRIWFSPGIGKLGDNDLFAFRAGYSPNIWLGYEIALGHNPAESLHAMLHTFNVVLRHPLPGRFQPYGTLGYGMMTAYPGQAINADPVTKNALMFGGGLELYLRNDVALRGEVRGATVLGQEQGSEGTVAFDYREFTIGLSFFRSLSNGD